jgi:hypothetical protein
MKKNKNCLMVWFLRSFEFSALLSIFYGLVSVETQLVLENEGETSTSLLLPLLCCRWQLICFEAGSFTRYLSSCTTLLTFLKCFYDTFLKFSSFERKNAKKEDKIKNYKLR